MSQSFPYAELFAQAARLSPKLVTWRRHLHANPELSFEEKETQRFIKQQLDTIGVDYKTIAGTGVLVRIEGEKSCGKGQIRRHVAIRADIDALPIQEVNGRSYGSQRAGVMHACGHDVHTTSALGAIVLMHGLRDEFCGSVTVIFQPGEEVLPGGATKVIAEGGLNDVQAIAALHVDPALEVGQFGFRSGAYMASTDELHLTLTGEGGHAALAHKHQDLIATFSQLVTASQQIVSRKAPSTIPTVLSWGSVSSEGGATNVLASKLQALGTLRTYDESWRVEAHRWLRQVVKHSCEMFGAQYELEIREGYPALDNDENATLSVRKAVALLHNGIEVFDLTLRPTAEDFAWYLQHVPGCFFRLGVGNAAEGITAGVHRPDFDVDERCLPYGAAALAAAALALLQDANGK